MEKTSVVPSGLVQCTFLSIVLCLAAACGSSSGGNNNNGGDSDGDNDEQGCLSGNAAHIAEAIFGQELLFSGYRSDTGGFKSLQTICDQSQYAVVQGYVAFSLPGHPPAGAANPKCDFVTGVLGVIGFYGTDNVSAPSGCTVDPSSGSCKPYKFTALDPSKTEFLTLIAHEIYEDETNASQYDPISLPFTLDGANILVPAPGYGTPDPNFGHDQYSVYDITGVGGNCSGGVFYPVKQ